MQPPVCGQNQGVGHHARMKKEGETSMCRTQEKNPPLGCSAEVECFENDRLKDPEIF